MAKFHQPKAPGYVCPKTGRVAVLAADLARSDMNGDAWAYFYNEEADRMGLEAWRLVEGIDPHTHGNEFDLCFANGTFKTVGPLMTVFLGAADAARLAEELTSKNA